MTELGSYESKKRFLVSFNILQAPPKKKRKQMLKKKQYDYLQVDRPCEEVYSSMEERI